MSPSRPKLSRNAQVVIRVVFVLVLVAVGVLLMQKSFRAFEARAATRLLNFAGTERVFWSGASSIGILPMVGPAFKAIVTVPCSALPSLLALTSLAAPIQLRRRGKALIAALLVVSVGNIVRIAASVAVGVYAGRSSLILFHDWVGSVFAFGYTLGGYILLIYILLPRERESRLRSWNPISKSPWRRLESPSLSSPSAGV